MVLDEQCADCIHEDPDGACPVALVQLTHNYDQVNNKHLEQAMATLIDKKGVCQMKKQLEKYYRKKPSDMSKKQMSLF